MHKKTDVLIENKVKYKARRLLEKGRIGIFKETFSVQTTTYDPILTRNDFHEI